MSKFDLRRLECNLNQDKGELQWTLEFLRDQINQALEALGDEHLLGLNELGIFQLNGPRADTLVAKIKLQYRILKELQSSDDIEK